MRRVRGKKSKDKLAVVIILSSLLAIAAPFIVKSYLPKAAQLHEETLCPIEGEKSRVAVLIDKSDKWGSDDVERVKAVVEKAYTEVPAFGRISIYGIIGEGRETTDVKLFFDMCNPGSEEECNALYQNCRKMKRQYETAFAKPFKLIAETLMQPGEASYSPLFEVVNEIVDENRSEYLHLHVISDLMENGARFRFYDVVPLAEDIVKTYPMNAGTRIQVDAHYIQRRRHSSALHKAVLNVWSEYFASQGVEASFSRLFVAE
jgi:hypothetical protein